MFYTTLLFISLVIWSKCSAQTCKGQTAPLNRLADGRGLPMIGLGTYNIREQDVMDRVIEDAIDVGYRHIDTAFEYNNEKLIGNSLKKLFDKNKIKRSDIFVTSKVWNTFHRRSKVIEGLKLSLKDLQLDYLDLGLVHWPMAYKEGQENHPKHSNGSTIDLDISVVETWRGMEDAYKMGLVKSIGVSNFNSEQLNRVLKQTFIKPVVNQIECNPYITQEKLVNFCKSKGIEVVAYSPIGRGDKDLLNETVLKEIANKYKKSVAQVMMRWLIQRNITVIPKTTRKERLIENICLFDFKLTRADMKKFYRLNKNKRIITLSEAINNKEYPFLTDY